MRDLTGTIERVAVARTIMRRYDGSRVFIPNGIFADDHQTTRHAHGHVAYELRLEVARTTPLRKMQRLIDELKTALVPFAVPVRPALRSTDVATLGGDDDSLLPPLAQRQDSITSTATSSVVPDEDLRVFLRDMYELRVSLLLDPSRHRTVENAKSEVKSFAIVDVPASHDCADCAVVQVNLAVLAALQRLRIRARQLN